MTRVGTDSLAAMHASGNEEASFSLGCSMKIQPHQAQVCRWGSRFRRPVVGEPGPPAPGDRQRPRPPGTTCVGSASAGPRARTVHRVMRRPVRREPEPDQPRGDDPVLHREEAARNRQEPVDSRGDQNPREPRRLGRPPASGTRRAPASSRARAPTSRPAESAGSAGSRRRAGAPAGRGRTAAGTAAGTPSPPARRRSAPSRPA